VTVTTQRVSWTTTPVEPDEVLRLDTVSPRYADLADQRLALYLTAEDEAEDGHRLLPDLRLTCHTHRRWLHDCVSSPLHVNAWTRARWCRPCEQELEVAVDHVAGRVAVTCPGCRRGAENAVDYVLITNCETSLRLARSPWPVLP
jgi:hypothetical protein